MTTRTGNIFKVSGILFAALLLLQGMGAFAEEIGKGNEPLVPSGLLGPVTVCFGKRLLVAEGLKRKK